jgi:anti-sigma B factor antagonist
MATLETKDTEGVKWVRLIGSLTCEGVDEVSDAFAAATQGAGPLVIDLSDVSVIATPGIAMLLNVDRQLKGTGGRMILTGTHDFVQEVLHRCRLDRIWTVIPDPSQALDQARHLH